MNKYEKYLNKMTRELEREREEIERLDRPERQLDRMRSYYSKSERLNNYFSKYRDKDSGGENYRNFLSARGKYDLRYSPYGKEEKVIASFEKTLGGSKKHWNASDWEVYAAVRAWRIDYTWNGWRKERW